MVHPSLVLLGLSGNAREALDFLSEGHDVVAIVDDRIQDGEGPHGIPVVSRTSIHCYPAAHFLCLIGSELTYGERLQIIEHFGVPESRYATVISQRAFVSETASLGAGTVIFPGAMVMSDARLGKHVLVLPNSVIHHDTVIGDCCVVGANVVIAGGVHVGEACFVGSASSIKDGITIGTGALIGMGSNVIRNVAPFSRVAGNPARCLRKASSVK
jgi:sugar O-acyltransferase (sialic acid O-acetyltransferase NeuD family)